MIKDIPRLIHTQIHKDLDSKFVLLSGPRQSGKTTLARSLFLDQNTEYLNYDIAQHRKKIIKLDWNRAMPLLVLDEIHKMKKWKQWLKGLYDSKESQKVLVTGSAKIDTFKKVGDSMAGRYFQFCLFPFDIKELKTSHWKGSATSTDKLLDQLLRFSGFPEPFLVASEVHYKRWRKTHLDIIIKQDIVETESIKRIGDLETLMELMVDKVGAPLSHNSLREDLLTDDKSVKRWLLALENAYVFFKITPYFKNMKHALRKAPKYYFFDFPRVTSEGAKLENFVAFSLHKEISLRGDLLGENYSLHYLQNKAGHEVDFLICHNKKPIVMIEVKSQKTTPSVHLEFFAQYLKKENPKLQQVQLVKNLSKPYESKTGVKVLDLGEYLLKMPF